MKLPSGARACANLDGVTVNVISLEPGSVSPDGAVRSRCAAVAVAIYG
jgi:hypothetical protein